LQINSMGNITGHVTTSEASPADDSVATRLRGALI
jgi:hypothetical protein